tara:strand:- start:13 stop:294 length:282 start_codon:yes stop_codon:yes gene_type:complete
MGRAIDMEKDIYILKEQVKKLDDIVRGMTHEMDGLSEKSTKTTHIDLVDDVKVEEDSDVKKANNKTSSKSSGRVKKSNGRGKDKNNKHGNSDK